MDNPMITSWRGKDIKKLTREELIDALESIAHNQNEEMEARRRMKVYEEGRTLLSRKNG